MSTHKNKTRVFTAGTILMIVFLIAGCSGKKGKEDNVVASINSYKMTVEDFEYESGKTLNLGGIFGASPVTKQEMLDALITKEVLIQEAVKENLDKEKDFMRAIELYWEQTLLKNLLAGKSEEIAKNTVVYPDEIVRYYEMMKTKLSAKVFVFSDEKFARKGMTQKADTLESWESDPQKFAISYVIPSRWYVLGEGQSPFEYQIFLTGFGSGKNVVNMNGAWALIMVDESASNDVGPIISLKTEIAGRMRVIKSGEAMDQWIDSLRSKARVKVDKKIFNSLN